LKNEELMIRELKDDFDNLENSLATLEFSLGHCREIGLKDKYEDMDLVMFESLTARFSRSSDIYTQKIVKGIVFLLRENAVTFIDRANLFEKLDISAAEDLKLIRDLRNEISHEYRSSDIEGTFEAVMEYSDKLLEIIEKTKVFLLERKIL